MDFYNIYKQDKTLLNGILKNFSKIIKNNNFILGDSVSKFEKSFSNFVGSKYTVGCANGTDAILLALKALNLPKNSEAILPAMTYCSTVFSVIHAGLRPILVDINKNDPLMDLKEVEKKISKKTTVIIPVHLYGSVVNIFRLKKIIKKKYPRIKILDDCAQAHGAFYCDNCNVSCHTCCQKGPKVGSLSDISAFSFYPGKNLGAYGDAGAVSTNNNKLYLRLRKYRNLGSEKKFKHDFLGYNSRLDSLQAAVLSKKLTKLKYNNIKRIKIANFYKKKILKKEILLNYSKGSIFHQFAILSNNKNKLKKVFTKNSIPYGEHYPVPIHKLSACKKIFKGLTFPNAENFAKKTLSLPMDPNLTNLQLKKVVDIINSN